MTGLPFENVVQAAIDHLASTGLFESVNDHEATSPPPLGITADVWFDQVRTLAAESGLDVTSSLLTLTVRIYISVNSQPLGDIETQLVGAVNTLMAAYDANFTFGGTVNRVDVMGEYGTSLEAVGGYMNVNGNAYRVATIPVACVIDDIWPQAE